MPLIDRVKNVLLTAKTEWPVIAGETANVQSCGPSRIVRLGPIRSPNARNAIGV